MLSILIPTYNYEAVSFVKVLQKQAEECLIPYEIIVMDDGSLEFKEANREINSIPNCIYIELKTNVGRSKIRNLLAEKAQYNWLLFIDSDGEVVSNHFIKKYLPFCKEGAVVCGGRVYQVNHPEEKNHCLHWVYGKKREALTAKERQHKPNSSFMSNNFLIYRPLFKEVGFEETIVEYGYEDTLLGFMLKQRGISIYHIDNPLLHNGIETSRIFIEKTKKSIQNLLKIYQMPHYKSIESEVKLLRVYVLIKKFHLGNIYKNTYKHLHPMVSKNLIGNKPSMFFFDLFKLAYLCKIDK